MFTSKFENRIEAVKSGNRLTESWLRAGELNATRMAYEASMTPVHLPAENLVREAGVEPAASRLSIECSNHAELFPVVLLMQRVEPRATYRACDSGANGANRTLIGWSQRGYSKSRPPRYECGAPCQRRTTDT